MGNKTLSTRRYSARLTRHKPEINDTKDYEGCIWSWLDSHFAEIIALLIIFNVAVMIIAVLIVHLTYYLCT